MTKIPFAIAIAVAALSIVPAGAADMGRFPPAARFYPPPPPVLRVYNWTGCYLGAQLGGAFADNKIYGEDDPAPTSASIFLPEYPYT